MTGAVSGRYLDQSGRRWMCVQREVYGRQSVACNSDDGWFTAATPETFSAWRWKPESPTQPTSVQTENGDPL